MCVAFLRKILLTSMLVSFSMHLGAFHCENCGPVYFSETIDFPDQHLSAHNEGSNCNTKGVDGCNKSVDIFFDLTNSDFTPGTDLSEWSVSLYFVDDEDSSSSTETSGSWTNASSGNYQRSERLRLILGGVNFGEFNGLNNGMEDISATGRTEFTVTHLDNFQSVTAQQVQDVFSGIKDNGKLKAVYQTFGGDMIIKEATLSVTAATIVPVPAAAWLMGSALLGLVTLRNRR